MEHPSYALEVTHYLSISTIAFGVIVIIFAIILANSLVTKKTDGWVLWLTRYSLPIGFFTSLFGTALTLYYEYGLQYAPCDLCWYQRVFLYSQMFIFGYAWMKKDHTITVYTCMLSVVGFAIALYHHFLQIGFDLMKPCSTAPFAVDCSKPSFIEFGFVTFPFMAMVLFGFLAVLSFAVIKLKK